MTSAPEVQQELLPQHLPEHESAELAQCEAVIQAGIVTFTEVGNALLTIKEKRLYRDQFSTFKDYCSTKWAISTRRAYQLIEAAEVVTNITTLDASSEDVKKITQFPNEAQARELAKVPPADQKKVWGAVVESGRPTAKKIEAVAAEIVEPKPKSPPKEKEALRDLKKWWKRANKADRAAFMDYIRKDGFNIKSPKKLRGSYSDWQQWRDACDQMSSLAALLLGLTPDAQHIIPARDSASKVCHKLEAAIKRVTE